MTTQEASDTYAGISVDVSVNTHSHSQFILYNQHNIISVITNRRHEHMNESPVRVAKPVHSHDRFTPRSKARIGANRESAVPDHHQDIEIFS